MSIRSQVWLGALAVAASVAIALPAQAQQVRVRGTIAAVDGSQGITVTGRDGAPQTLALTPATRYSAIKPLKMADIKQNSFVGVAGKPGPNGQIEALEVVVFPEEARGTGEGHYDWDLLPGSSMTNATVTALVSGKSGQDLELSYKGGAAKVKVPVNAPVVTFVPATAGDLKAGLAIFAVATASPDGKLSAARIVLERDGVKPPM